MNAHVPQAQEPILETESEWKVRTKKRLRAESIARYGCIRCHYCGRKVSNKAITLDHVQPKVQGGQNIATNAVLSCKPCNASKGGLTLTEWANVITSQADSVFAMLASLCEVQDSGKGVRA